MRIRIVCVAVIALAATSLRAGTIVEDDFRGVPGAAWVLAGSTRVVEGTGAILVERDELGTGTLALDAPLASEHLSVRVALTLECGAHGLGDGFAIGLLATPTPAILGDGAGLLGLGNVPACAGALVVEFDAFPNAPEDFGPASAGRIHAGAAYSPGGAITGEAFLPTFAAADLRGFRCEGEKLAIDAEVHIHDGSVIVCAGTDGLAPLRILEAAIPDYAPFSGYLVFGAANGGIPGRASIATVKVETDALPPPRLQGRIAPDGAAELTWQADDGIYTGFRMFRDGESVAILDATAREFRDEPPAPGAHVYEIVASDGAGRDAPPTGTTLYAGKPFLVVDRAAPGAEPSPHARAWIYALTAVGKDVVRVGSVKNEALERFAAVLFVNGSGATQGALPADEQDALAAYVRSAEGARLYLEGAELWSSPLDGPLGAADGIRASSDAWPCTMVFDAHGSARAYFGEMSGIDTLAPASEELAGAATALWRRATPASPLDAGDPVAIVTRTEADRAVVIGASMELCRLLEGHEEALAGYLDLLSLPYDPPRFMRGDASADGRVDIADAINILAHLFGTRPLPVCPDAADANDDGALQISDPIAVLTYLFAGRPLPAPGGRACGADPTPDALPVCRAGSCR